MSRCTCETGYSMRQHLETKSACSKQCMQDLATTGTSSGFVQGTLLSRSVIALVARMLSCHYQSPAMAEREGRHSFAQTIATSGAEGNLLASAISPGHGFR